MKVRNDGAELALASHGDPSKPALLLYPSGGASRHIWDHLIPRLTDRFRVVQFDIRGVGESRTDTDDEAQFTFEQYAKDATAALDAFEIEKCHIWSQSWGSRPAIWFAAAHAERVSSAAFYAANTELPDVPAQRKGSKVAAERQRRHGISPVSPAPGWDAHAQPETVALAMGALRKADLAAVLDRLTMPILIGTGDCDPNLASSRVIAAKVPSARLAVLADVGHNAILEHVELALSTFLDFHDSLAP